MSILICTSSVARKLFLCARQSSCIFITLEILQRISYLELLIFGKERAAGVERMVRLLLQNEFLVTEMSVGLPNLGRASEVPVEI